MKRFFKFYFYPCPKLGSEEFQLLVEQTPTKPIGATQNTKNITHTFAYVRYHLPMGAVNVE